ncbi:MAG: PqqD family protein [Planctomycetes bacterium]|nr:PqqD family protein [Planctomycetota bacterium]
MKNDCSYKINKEFVVFEHLDAELTVINLKEGHYFLGRESAIEVFLMLEEPKTVDDMVSQTQAIYSVEDSIARNEIDALLKMWLENDLIMATDESSTLAVKNDTELGAELKAWIKPAFIAFDDMRDLLLLDPIHETDLDQQGWPVADT